MNTPLQQAARNLITQFEADSVWANYPWVTPKIAELRKALEDEQAQAVEPKCVARIEVFGNDWRLDYLSLPVGIHKLYAQTYTFTHPTPPPAGDLASLISRAGADASALNSRIMEPFYCSLDQDAARVLSDCVDMLEANAVLADKRVAAIAADREYWRERAQQVAALQKNNKQE